MTWTVLPIGTGNTPQFSSQQERQARSSLMVPAGSSRPLGARSGRRPFSFTVDVSAWPVIKIGPGSGVLDVETPVETGPYQVANSADDTSLSGTAAHSTLERVDGVYLELLDNTVDSSGQFKVAPLYVSGTPAASNPAPPADPAPSHPTSHRIARITVPHAGSGSPSVTMEDDLITALGGLLPIPSQSARDALPNKYDSLPIYRLDTGNIEIYNGSTWDTFTKNNITRLYGNAVTGLNWDGTSPIIIQEFAAIANVSAATFTLGFPSAFPHGLLNLNVTMQGDSGHSQLYVSSFTLSQFVGQVWDKLGATPSNIGVRLFVHAVGW